MRYSHYIFAIAALIVVSWVGEAAIALMAFVLFLAFLVLKPRRRR